MLSACAVVPDGAERYIDERNALFQTVPDAPAEWAARGVAGAAPTGDWLSQFNDPVMTQLVGEALARNPTLASRAGLTRAPEALTRAARGQRLPSLSASGSAGATSTGAGVAGTNERFNNPLYGETTLEVYVKPAPEAVQTLGLASTSLNVPPVCDALVVLAALPPVV